MVDTSCDGPGSGCDRPCRITVLWYTDGLPLTVYHSMYASRLSGSHGYRESTKCSAARVHS